MQYITPLWPAYPELFLLGMACAILVADLFVSDDNRIITYALTQIALSGCFALTFLTASADPVTTFSGMFVDDLMADVLKLLVYLGVSLVYGERQAAVNPVFAQIQQHKTMIDRSFEALKKIHENMDSLGERIAELEEVRKGLEDQMKTTDILLERIHRPLTE